MKIHYVICHIMFYIITNQVEIRSQSLPVQGSDGLQATSKAA